MPRFAALTLIAAACTPEGELASGKNASVEALFFDFSFDGQLVVDSSWGADRAIQNQMLFTVGQLNGDRSVSRLDKLQVSDVQTERTDDGMYRVSYHATMPVAWAKDDVGPETYTLKLPTLMTWSGMEAFTEKYSHSCVDYSAHDVDTGSMWYYYRPSHCTLDAADVYDAVATVTPADNVTSGKYPEYHKVWEDDALKVVAVFGKYEDGATDNSDAGISAYNEFVRAAQTELSSYSWSSVPSNVGNYPGVATPDITFSAELPDGRKVQIVALLIDGVQSADATFDARYGALSSDADMIAYNGHSGLGENIRQLARKGEWRTGQYVMVFMNGCDTYAYVDDAILEGHVDVNSDDPVGTKYVDMITNGMPAYFANDAEASMAFVHGLLSYSDPQTYEQMFNSVDSSQVVMVTGEEDNTFQPGVEETQSSWEGLDESGTVTANEEHHFETPVLDAGTYTFEMTGTGDADLYVRVGQAPDVDTFDCRPYEYGSDEVCTVELTAAAAIYAMVRGYDESNDYVLKAR